LHTFLSDVIFDSVKAVFLTLLQIIGRPARIPWMQPLYQRDLAYVHAAAFGTLARGAAGEIVRRLQSCSTRVRRVLDVGCGAGPLTEALINAGFEVTGIDSSAELLELARANVPTAHFVHASVYDVQIRAYDAVVALGEPLTYQAEGATPTISSAISSSASPSPYPQEVCSSST
jgi:SAM-dependent methyltransferase